MAKKDKNKNLQKYLKRIEAAEQWRDTAYKELWARCYKRYRNYVDALKDPITGELITDQSNISIPYSFVQVETILPRLVETMFATRPYISVLEREPGDETGAKKNETLMDWQMNERMDIRKIFAGGLKGCLIYGTAVAYTGWKWEEKEVIRKQLEPVLDEETGEQMLDMNQQSVMDWTPMRMNVIDYDDPDVKFLDLGLFYCDPHASGAEDARYCGHVSYETKVDLQKMAELKIYKINWKNVPVNKEINKARDYRMNEVGLPTVDDQVDESSEDALYEVLHYWEDDKHVVIINRSEIALEAENPYWHKKLPYDIGVYCDVPGELYGMGVMEMVEDLQEELNTERNMRIDFRSFLLRRMFKVRRDANISTKELVWRQGGVIHVDNADDVTEMGIQDAPNSTFIQEDRIQADMQDTTGAHDVVMGTANSTETATGTMTKDNNASMRFRLAVSNLEKALLVSVARKMMQMNQQFVDDERLLRVTGDNGITWEKVLPDEIQGEFDMIAAGTSVEPLANKEAYKQRMVELYNVAKSDPIYQQFPNKRMALLKKVFESFDIKDTEAILPTDEELRGLMQPQGNESPLNIQPGQGAGLLEQLMPGAGQGQLNTAAQVEQGRQI